MISTIVKFFVDNWAVLVGAACLIAFVIGKGWKVIPMFKQMDSMKEWLKIAVVLAEKELGSGTGQLKLRWVYDKAVERFPWVKWFISFEAFILLVDEALDWMQVQMDENEKVKEYVKG